MQNQWFKDWFNSPYYHQLYAGRNYEEAASFIDKLLLHLNPGSGSTMLDIACGKGRHAIHLAGKGYDVTGIDLSKDSIEEASLSETENLHFYQHDMRLPFWINYFDYAFNFFTSFGYFQSVRENYNVVETIHKALKPGGKLVMDFMNVPYFSQKLIPWSRVDTGTVQFNIERYQTELAFFKTIYIWDKINNTNQQFREELLKFQLPDFEKMFSHFGLEIKEVFGDYLLQPFDPEHSPRLILIAEKAS
jgi:SAM-dependent methyltransferase